ncbi:zinc finger mynd domain containing protein 10 [Holotrichia oblita]|uniref:Zinc finger mynd domain containing protein 10 n=1 Tax=Holotrichia oblita TaxID=644536 RepID=A0ACB9TQL5_HOLOL|nr:zinc finger mynd domain containing protein 10 [Holotrichia oblita]
MENVLLPSEVEFYIDTMAPTELERLGSKQWLEWHQRLQKLNQEAVLEASAVKEEFVKETLVSFNKTPVLVHEAILINIWKNKLLPILLRLCPDPENTFVAYSILFHEATSVALLELVLYHPSSSESLGDYAADLLSYAYDAVAQLLVTKHSDEIGENGRTEILRQKDDLLFEIGIRCLTIIRYIAENVERLSYSIIDRILNIHDVPVLLIEILGHRPWIQDDKLYKGSRWIKWDGEALAQCEAQVWLALYQILMIPSCGKYYEITDSRRSQLMKLLPLMNPVLMDQLSPLCELKYWLCQLSVSNQPTVAPKPILLEIVLEIKNAILAQGEGKWKKIAKEQLPLIFGRDKKELMEIAQGLCAAYNTDLIEKFECKEEKQCGTCGKVAIQRCSRCKNQWYCSRNCQVQDWESHKVNCIEPTTVS